MVEYAANLDGVAGNPTPLATVQNVRVHRLERNVGRVGGLAV